MKVNPQSIITPAVTGEPKAAPNKASTSGAGANTAASGTAPAVADASIQISSASRGLQSSDGADATSFDAARVDVIKQAISQGRFQVNSHAVADKLIASAQDLLTAGSGQTH